MLGLIICATMLNFPLGFLPKRFIVFIGFGSYQTAWAVLNRRTQTNSTDSNEARQITLLTLGRHSLAGRYYASRIKQLLQPAG